MEKIKKKMIEEFAPVRAKNTQNFVVQVSIKKAVEVFSIEW